LKPIESSTIDDVKRAIERAREAQPAWEALGLKARIAKMKEMARHLVAHRDEVIEILQLETGRGATECLMSEAVGPVVFCKAAIRPAKQALKPEKLKLSSIEYPGKKITVEAVPRGVIGIIAPWNYPLGNFFKPIFPALLAGNGVVMKPSEHTPRTGAWLAEKINEVLPNGLVGLVQGRGEIGQAIIEGGVDAIVFTGSVATGRRVAKAAGERLIPCSVELGGKDAAIVLADCNFDRTVAGVAQWAFHNAGQNCAGIERVIVEDAIADRFVERLGMVAGKLRVAPEEPSDLGPLQNEPQLRIVEEHVADALDNGAVLVTGGKGTGSGFGYEPTVLDRCTPDMKVVREETFGPVVAVLRVGNAEEAVTLANHSDFGLNGSVWTTDIAKGERMVRRLEVGVAVVNNHSFSGAMPASPWSGVKNTGPGVSNSRHAYSTFVRRRAVFVDRGRKPDPWWFPANDDTQALGDALAAHSLGSFSAVFKLAGLVGKRVKAIREWVSSG
jgi:acyl-CoA reductase-like NAD-dependent aldehyde dehydrogenase